MARQKELRIYCVELIFNNNDYVNVRKKVQALSDEEFITEAKNEGNVFTLNRILYNIGGNLQCAYELPEFCEARAYLIDLFNPESKPIRVDQEDMGFLIEDVFKMNKNKQAQWHPTDNGDSLFDHLL